MSTAIPDTPSVTGETLGSDLVGMASFYVDPAGAARRVHYRWFWLGPLIILSICSILCGLAKMPIVEHAFETLPLPGNAPPDRVPMIVKTQYIFVWLSPLVALLIYAFDSLILLAMGAIFSVKAKFLEWFNLVAGLSLISMLGLIAGTVILKAKGEVGSFAELQPALGLDIFAPEGTNKFLVGLLSYFNVFELWWLVMAVLIISAAFRVSKGKAFVVVVPLVVLGIAMRLLAATQRTSETSYR